MSNLLSFVRSAVSKDKIRFRDGQFDLDLTYITDNLIAMGFPASGVEATYRNNINQVAEMLNSRHLNHYMIWNLSERTYDYSLFNNQIMTFGWPDHHAPALNYLFKILSSLDSWLKADPLNVGVVHCLAGKGRTGTVLCSYLLYSGAFEEAAEALHFFGNKRSCTKSGVEQPSQIRYVSYLKQVISGHSPRPKTRWLQRVIMRPVPAFSHLNGVRPILQICDTTRYPETLIFSSSWFDKETRHIDPEEGKVEYHMNVRCKGDVVVRCFHVSTRFRSMTTTVPMFRAQFHTGFLPDRKTNPEVFILRKDRLDLAYRDSRFPDNFQVEFVFEPYTNETDDEEDDTWSEEAHQNFMTVANKNLQAARNMRQHNQAAKQPQLDTEDSFFNPEDEIEEMLKQLDNEEMLAHDALPTDLDTSEEPNAQEVEAAIADLINLEEEFAVFVETTQENSQLDPSGEELGFSDFCLVEKNPKIALTTNKSSLDAL
jgi:protein-tyrosine phosphatase